MAWWQVGQGSGTPWLVLHGGPGSGSSAGLLAPFDLNTQRVILPDQRGAGASTPRGSLRGNHTAQLVADLERLRQHLGLARWHVLAGSWGTVLALAYAQRHPGRVASLVLRGGFALSRREIDRLLSRAPPPACYANRAAQRARLSQVLQFGTLAVATQQVRAWQLLEQAAVQHGQWRALRHTPAGSAHHAARRAWAQTRRAHRRGLASRHRPGRTRGDHGQAIKFLIQARYLQRRGFVRPGALDGAVRQLAQHGVPVDWVHGRCDAVCPPANSRRWLAVGTAAARDAGTQPPRAHWPVAGHLGGEPALLLALRAVVQR
ncbi:alpha/beta fold hydrolase [Hydrogenophaga sp. OTU3427]|uniref:alpha/beta fold hydrolase n=1 Tax=Hydrogenophaga sp. OTU3427 TaxID=3043856 RepID=UPI00313CF3DA